MQDAETKGRQDVSDAYAASSMAQAGAKATRAKSNYTDLNREIRDQNGVGDGDFAWKGAITGAGTVLLSSLAAAIPGIGLALAATL
jgi:hypothetical protein